jgi:hypothetical protein
MTMARLLTLLMMLVLAIANGPAVAAAICEHRDARSHAAAAASADAGVSAEAIGEETAAKAAGGDGALGDAASTLLAGYLLPAQPSPLPFRTIEASAGSPGEAAVLVGRSVPPLLEPPLA